MSHDTMLRDTTPDALPSLDHDALQRRGRRRRVRTRVAGGLGVLVIVAGVGGLLTTTLPDRGTPEVAGPGGGTAPPAGTAEADAAETARAAARSAEWHAATARWERMTLPQALDELRRLVADAPGRTPAADEDISLTSVSASGAPGGPWTNVEVLEMRVAADGTTSHLGHRADGLPFDDDQTLAERLLEVRDVVPTVPRPDEGPDRFDVAAELATAEARVADGDRGWQTASLVVDAGVAATDATTMRRVLDLVAGLDVVTWDGPVVDPLGRPGVALRMTDPESGLAQQLVLSRGTGYPVAVVELGADGSVHGFGAIRQVIVGDGTGAQPRRDVDCDAGYHHLPWPMLADATSPPPVPTECRDAGASVTEAFAGLTTEAAVERLRTALTDERPAGLTAVEVLRDDDADVRTVRALRGDETADDFPVRTVLDEDAATTSLETPGYLPTWTREAADRALRSLAAGGHAVVGTGLDVRDRPVVVLRAVGSGQEVHVDPTSGYTTGVVVTGHPATDTEAGAPEDS